jgi:hypothetical protein
MVDKFFRVYVIQGRSERDYTDCKRALEALPAHLEVLSFLQDEAEVIEHIVFPLEMWIQ